MPQPPLPADVKAFLELPNPAVVASLRPDGSPRTVATWYAWEDDRLLLNMDESRMRLQFMRDDPRVSVTVLDHEDWGRHVSLYGRVASIEEDVGLRDIDRLALRYSGRPFGKPGRTRYSAWVELDSWYGWIDTRPWPVG
jgi:PPOX class probable F420-dependent enzyme